MPRFQFKLQSVLNHRQIVEDQAQRALAQVLRQRMILMGQIQQMQSTITQSKRDLSGSLVGRVDLAQVADFTRYSAQVSQRAGDIVRRLAQLEPEINAARGKLIKATTDRKAMELLRDRHRKEWEIQEARRETAQLDELATQGYMRQMAEAVL